MSWTESLRTALGAVRTHRMRSALTMLGILIGIAAVILTVGLGEGAQNKVKAQINALGTNLLVISPGSSTSSTTGLRGGFGSSTTLTVSDANALASPVVAPDIKAVAPTLQSSETLLNGSTNWSTTVIGTTPDWLSVRARSLAEGRFLSAGDEQSDAAVVVLGATTASELFPLGDPVGQNVLVGGVQMQVVGVLTASGSTGTSNNDDMALIPLSTAQQRVFGGTSRTEVQDIYVEATKGSTLSAAYQEANAELLNLHGITTASDADFTITTQQSLVSTATSVDKTLTILLGGIAGISLLVGGIGVMNIMLVSVTERVREIGLRKALGATPALIRRQFLLEASVLGLVGGVLGVALGAIGSSVLPHLLNDPITLSPSASVAAVGVAVLVGIVFGVYPASRAARLAPIDALRSE
ncbi:MAG TPA: ABC transporter permease [Mycobacteriales bacterium]